MQKNKAQTNEGIKAGPTDSVSLQREDGNKAPANKAMGTQKEDLTGEIDADDMVHEPHNEFATDDVEQDLDEVVHDQGSITTAKAAEDDLTDEKDMDELVHRVGRKL